MDSTSRAEENPARGSAIPPVVVVPEDGQGNVSPTSLVEKIFNDPEALTMLRKAILNEESGEALKARHPQERNAGALKARETATTLEGPATKRPRRADSYENVEFEENFSGENDESFMIDDEDGQAQSASRWQASEELSSFLDSKTIIIL